MSHELITRLQAQRDGPRDGALLRFSLGNALLADDRAAEAIVEFQRALAFDPYYTAAWKLLGKAAMASGDIDVARNAWERGIVVAAQRGDKQAEKEMTVFLRRLDK